MRIRCSRGKGMKRGIILIASLCCGAAWAASAQPPQDTMPIVTKPTPVFERSLPDVPFQGPRSKPLTEEERQPETPVAKPIAPKVVTPRVDTPAVASPKAPKPMPVGTKKPLSPEMEAIKALEELPLLEEKAKAVPEKKEAPTKPAPSAKPVPGKRKPKATMAPEPKAPLAYMPTLPVPVPGIVSGMREAAFVIEARKAFRRADTDRDGVLREEELLELKAAP